jgi:hypothetical protein
MATIQIKRSTTATNVPVSLAQGELAINTQDEKLFYANAATAVQTIDLTAIGSALQNVVEDTTPQLGGTLDVNSQSIQFPTTTISDVLDEDNMASDSATALATQQSIKAYVDNTVSGAGHLSNVVEDTTPQLGGTLDAQTNKITNLGAPTASTDAATKGYVDGVASGLDVKESVRALADADIDLAVVADPSPVDGVTLANGDRILLTGQTAGAENGIYDAVTAADPTTWVRSSDADTSAEVTAGMFTFIEEGTSYADTGWVLATDDPITLDTTALSFTQFSGTGSITAGGGLTKTGDTLDVGAGTGITVNANDVQISATYSGQTSITTLGTVATGTWEATDVAVAHGGTGASTAAGARTNLGVDPAGTDNSTNVTLAGALDYITISGQEITRNAIDLGTDVTGTLDGGTF